MTNEQFRAWLKRPREGHPRGLTQRAAADLLGIAPNRVWAMAREKDPVRVSRQTERQIEMLEEGEYAVRLLDECRQRDVRE